jgi:predicted HicB family RNase H-like nuclease
MNTMSHKGYTAKVELDERDNIFVGRVLGIHTVISFHGEAVGELLTSQKHRLHLGV